MTRQANQVNRRRILAKNALKSATNCASVIRMSSPMRSFKTDVSGVYLIVLSALRTLLLRRIELHRHGPSCPGVSSLAAPRAYLRFKVPRSARPFQAEPGSLTIGTILEIKHDQNKHDGRSLRRSRRDSGEYHKRPRSAITFGTQAREVSAYRIQGKARFRLGVPASLGYHPPQTEAFVRAVVRGRG